MNISLQEIVFYIVGACIIACSILAVTTGKILRAATYLLFVLLGTGAIYGILGYTFLSAVQLMVYAGGIVVLYVFSILLTQVGQEYEVQNKPRQVHQCIADHCYRCSSRAFLSYDQRICPEPDSTGSRTSGRKHRTCLDWYREIPVCITI